MVIEDINMAPEQILSLLKHVIETRTLMLPRGGILEANENFKMVATVTSGQFKSDILYKMTENVKVRNFN